MYYIKDAYTYYYKLFYNKNEYTYYYKSLDEAYHDIMKEIKKEYSWIKKNSGKYKKIFF
jgi:hypothetical protein